MSTFGNKYYYFDYNYIITLLIEAFCGCKSKVYTSIYIAIERDPDIIYFLFNSL